MDETSDKTAGVSGKKTGRGTRGVTYAALMKMAKAYGVDKNALFVAAAKQYQMQAETLNMIRDTLKENGETVTTKEYVKGRENVCVHPLVAQLPKHADSANKTLATMLDIVQKLGKAYAGTDNLSQFRTS